jgi:hypothetical protein
MFGKLFRLAFMEKDTRKRWEAARAAPGDAKSASSKSASKSAPKTAMKTAAPAPGIAVTREDEAAMVRAAIAAAEQEMSADPRLPSGVVAPPAGASDTQKSSASVSEQRASERRQLIRSALTVHKLKQSALSDLDPKTRAQLRVMAEQMLGVDKPSN